MTPIIEVLLAATVMFLLFRPLIEDTRLLSILIALWSTTCIAIYFRYGWVGQLSFYSNDQLAHHVMVLKSERRLIPISMKEILADRMPYIVPSYIFSLLGLSIPLAMKTTSLMTYLSLVAVIRNHLKRQEMPVTIGALLLTVGPAVFFFSTLALRETTMALFVTYVFIGKSALFRTFALIGLLMLRPHIAFAVAVALVAAALWSLLKDLVRRNYFIVLGVSLLTAVIGGTVAYQIEFARRLGRPSTLGLPSSDQIVQVLGSFTGLQLLWADLDGIEKSRLELVLPRLLFIDTFLIPILFVIVAFVPVSSFRNTKFGLLVALGTYSGIVTSYEFQSFRQYLPFIPLMGLCVNELLWMLFRHRSDQKEGSVIRRGVPNESTLQGKPST